MKYKKSFFLIMMLSAFMTLNLMNINNMKFFNMKFFESFTFELSLNFSLMSDQISVMFLTMILFVVSLVSLFSEIYLEHYNMKKFFYIKFLFFFSMIILSSSSSMTNLMTGWDWLGISSLFLIMFYPNKMTLYNSYLTMMFNRLGDSLLILIFCLFLMQNQNFFYLISKNSGTILMFFILCSFTKSAQFPLSSWLPAAMSAPTPISAMVHSSTLVTAGLFLVTKMSFYLSNLKFSFFFFFFSVMSFLLGGALAKIEKDFKKIVAFSTLSQISMIMYFLFLGLLILGMLHMMIHAFFKTILFCCCGFLFLFNFSEQHFKKLGSNNNFKKIYWMLFLSIFSMSGLTFSGSFFSKDKVLEVFLLSSNFLFIILMLGSILTLFYCAKILESLKINSSNSSNSKKEIFIFFSLFNIISWMLGSMMMFIFPMTNFPMCEIMELTMIIILFFSIFFLESFKIKSNFLKYASFDISLMKSFAFSSWKNLMKKFNNKIFNSDNFVFKPSIMSLNFLESKSLLSEASKYKLYFLSWILILMF